MSNALQKGSSAQKAVSLNLRAVWQGATVDIAGSLVMATVIGLAAVTGMLVRGDTAESITAELPGSLALMLFVAAGGLVMSLAGGYVAATIAGRAHLLHALAAGALSVLLNLAVLAITGDSGPAWLTAIVTAAIVPCAIFGGWLAMPVPMTAEVVRVSR